MLIHYYTLKEQKLDSADNITTNRFNQTEENILQRNFSIYWKVSFHTVGYCVRR